jgi:hypothetical protein
MAVGMVAQARIPPAIRIKYNIHNRVAKPNRIKVMAYPNTSQENRFAPHTIRISPQIGAKINWHTHKP